MGVIVPEDDATVTMIYTCGGRPKEITWGFGLFGQVTPIDGQEAADAIYAAATDDPSTGLEICAATNMVATWHFIGVSVSVMTSTGPLVFQHLETVDGTMSGEACPVNCAILFKKNTALGGRKNRGRCYLPPSNVVEGDIDAIGGIGGDALVDLQAQMNNFLTAVGEADLFPCLHHSDGSTGTLISSITIEGTIATQRRRMR